MLSVQFTFTFYKNLFKDMTMCYHKWKDKLKYIFIKKKPNIFVTDTSLSTCYIITVFEGKLIINDSMVITEENHLHYKNVIALHSYDCNQGLIVVI